VTCPGYCGISTNIPVPWPPPDFLVKVLLLSAYAAESHVQWQHSLQEMFSDWSWRVLSLPPRHFSWRVRGNPLHWALEERGTLESDYDLLLATSMVDLATLRGLVPSLARIPAILYFHENQFDYPQDRQRHGLLEAQMVSLYSALAADRVLFNSNYNRDTFLEGCSQLLHRLPDFTPASCIPRLREKSGVLAVPLPLETLQSTASHWPGSQGDYPRRPLRLLWQGRFEHDKGGEGLQSLLRRLEEKELDYELAVVGQQFRDSPPVFKEIEREFGARLVQFGYLESVDDYRALLQGADIVVSTALHEFQGLAVLEAVASGCLPVVPDRLVYPEIYPSRFCYESRPGSQEEADAAASLIRQLANELCRGVVLPPDVSAYGSEALEEAYRALFQSLAG
jgi:glycosyltransferase involved in cell wall biosynthesis